MIMDLPREFSYGSGIQKDDAYIENGILIIRKTPSFYSIEGIAYELAFKLNGGIHKCAYCGKTFKNKKMTIDHMYPQSMGGPTITNNLRPACRQCNLAKTDMTLEEYKKWRQIRKQGEQKEFLSVLREKKEEIRRRKEYQIPREWLSEREITTILVDVRLEDNSQNRKYKKVERFFNEYGYFQKPIVVDRNRFLIDGYNTVIFAKNRHISSIPVIQLENVEVIFNRR